MKKRICIIVSLILLSQVIVSALPVSEARADTRVTVTFAAGGVACGAYFFLRFVLRSSSLIDQSQNDAAALFNHDTEGWHIKAPSLNFIGDEHPAILGSKDLPGTAQIELVKFRF